MKPTVRPAIALVPGAPVLVPELAGSATAECSDGTDAAVAMLRRAGADARSVEVRGVDPDGRSLGDVACSLRRWGVDVGVGRGTPTDDGAVPDAALLGWWFLDRAGLDVPRRFVPVSDPGGHEPADRVVVVADGPASLHPKAPIPEDPRGVALDAGLSGWLAEGGRLPDPGTVVAEEIGWWSRPAWLHLAGLLANTADPGAVVRPAVEHHSWAPFGVGYHTAVWSRPDDATPGASA